MNENEKPIVHYDSELGIKLFQNGTMLFPVDHNSDLVSNKSWVFTSKILTYDEESGILETLNTIYKPMEKI